MKKNKEKTLIKMLTMLQETRMPAKIRLHLIKNGKITDIQKKQLQLTLSKYFIRAKKRLETQSELKTLASNYQQRI